MCWVVECFIDVFVLVLTYSLKAALKSEILTACIQWVIITFMGQNSAKDVAFVFYILLLIVQ
jgi:hypothetical protein